MAATIGVCEKMLYNLALCKYFLLPWCGLGNYMLYVFNQQNKMLTMYMSAWNRPKAVNIYTDVTKMRRNLFVDLLVHEINGYRRHLPEDIKHYLRRITEKSIQ